VSDTVESREVSLSQQTAGQQADVVQAVSAAMEEALKGQPPLAREFATLFSPLLVRVEDFGLAWAQCAAILKTPEEDLAALWRRVLDATASRVDPRLLARLRVPASSQGRGSHGQAVPPLLGGSRREWRPMATYSARGDGTKLRASELRLTSLVVNIRPGARAAALRRIRADAQRLVEDAAGTTSTALDDEVGGRWTLTASIWPDTEVVWRWRAGSTDSGLSPDNALAQANRILRDAVLPALDRRLGLRT
jgi:hypothetical protein